MSVSMVPILLQSDDVPAIARRALREARAARPEDRALHLETAARALHREVGLDCADARELVGLAEASCWSC